MEQNNNNFMFCCQFQFIFTKELFDDVIIFNTNNLIQDLLPRTLESRGTVPPSEVFANAFYNGEIFSFISCF